MACLDDATVIALVSGALPESARGAALAHAASCEACRELVAETSRSLAPTNGGEDPGASLAPGTTVGRYTIVERLGAGGMGVVYVARDAALGRRVALKLLHAGASARDPSDERLAREAKAMARLEHPNAVAVYDLGEAYGRLFLAMELVRGDTLAAWRVGAPRSQREILEVLVGAGRGLAAAHAAGVVHRDFKPDNVLVGPDGRARVTDFGLARAEVDDSSARDLAERATMPASALTRAGTLLGTPAYMPPEQLRGEPADARADQFAFAMTAWEALHGERPFAGETIDDQLAAIARGVTPSSAIDAVLARALAPSRDDRFPSMEALLAALDAAVAPRPVRRWLALAALALVAVACVGGAALFLRARVASAPPSRLRECRGVDGVCGPRQFCHFQPGNVCGAAEYPGVCWPRPKVCTREIVACGCDGKTYTSGCDSNRSGVSSAYAGPCVKCSRRGGEACGTVISAGARDGTFCRYPESDRCGEAGAEGVCWPRPRACAPVDAPVCGCDGKEYANRCEAQRAGTGIHHEGRCRG